MRQLVRAVDELAERRVVGVGVLAHVHRREQGPERDGGPDDPLEQTGRRQPAAVGEQRVAHEQQVGDQLLVADVVAARLVPPAGA